MELILIGFMGSGKTTVSLLLGEMLNAPVTDLDDEIVHRAGMTIPDIFAQNGEEYFRQLEHDTLADIIKSDQGILATGGDSGRPLAKSLDEKGIADLQAQRQVNYDACADLTIKTDGLSPAAIAKEITDFLNLPVSAN